MTAMYSGSSVILQSIQQLPLLSVLMDATVSFEVSVELCQVVLHPSQKRTFLVDWGCSRMGHKRGYLNLSGRKCEEVGKSNDGEGAS